MGIPIDESLPPTDEEFVEPVPAPNEPSADPEAPPADAADQDREVSAGWRVGRMTQDIEVAEGDAIDQAMELPEADDEEE